MDYTSQYIVDDDNPRTGNPYKAAKWNDREISNTAQMEV